MTDETRPRDPGFTLARYYLAPRGISVTRFAQATGLTRKHISAIVNGRAAITAETAMRFALVLGNSAQFWLNQQSAVDLFDARARLEGDPDIEIGAFAQGETP